MTHQDRENTAYRFLDSGGQQKLEQFGPFRICRPCSQALWQPRLPKAWEEVDAVFTREGGSRWIMKKKLPSSWVVRIGGFAFKIMPTDFGHLGVFPEHRMFWHWIKEKIQGFSFSPRILNLFAYSGGASFAAAAVGAKVCHLDASKAAVQWARENAQLNQLEEAPIRWITDDVVKFLQRERKRGAEYDGIILDPPSFGRGTRNEVFKIERDLPPILRHCRALMSKKPLFLIVSSHTPGITPLVLEHLVREALQGFMTIDPLEQAKACFSLVSGEMLLSPDQDPSFKGLSWDLPCGSYARWSYGN